MPVTGMNPEDCVVSTAQVPPVTVARPVPVVAVFWLGAVHVAVAPPPRPAHDQDQGEALVTALAVPAEQRPVDGANAVARLTAVPQAPASMGVTLLEAADGLPVPAELVAVTVNV